MRHKTTGIANGQEEKDNEVQHVRWFILDKALAAGISPNPADKNAQDIEALNIFSDQISIPQIKAVDSSPATIHAESSSTTSETVTGNINQMEAINSIYFNTQKQKQIFYLKTHYMLLSTVNKI
ncbi:hypothetical protein T4E_5658 [Trichinella pseudospiralis]|uniref:Uncharacterized protein n=1 Tax=Trichinella pseudospiralis TaxID=6337 RepID=A0A0V0XUB8_TRIPS|nr:hypothetical protein T4E_5658 [Trichinella pseudospiralis]